MGGDGGRRDAGGVGEVAAGERALEQRPPLHRLRRWAAAGPVNARRRVVVTFTSPAHGPALQSGSGRNGGGGGGGTGGSSPRFPVSDIIVLSIGGRSYSTRILVVIGVQRMDRRRGIAMPKHSTRITQLANVQLQNDDVYIWLA